VEITEKTQFPGFGFSSGVEFGASQAKDEKKLRFGGSRTEGCDKLRPAEKRKWKSWLKR
jgi:hypothetical protein